MAECAARVLVVDHDESIRAMVRIILEREGCEVIAAYCAAVAIECARHSRFDLLITTFSSRARTERFSPSR